MKRIEKQVVENAYTYESYRQLIDNLFAENKTTGSNHSEAMLNYAKMNIARMNRLDKRGKLTDATLQNLQKITRPIIWLVITEGWCGDAAQIVPVLHKMTLENDNISMKFILRDEHLDIVDAFLTNGGRSIPKILILDAETLEVLKTWGPRPVEMQEMILEAKAQSLETEDVVLKKQINSESAKNLHLWYAKDKTLTTQQEFLAVAI
ncbi:MAG: thioredoxin family protein [Bacteroidetes bacterium]|jgi:hypothetical protein|nr:thioredoxin family protein [Bacteroidota bacterium]